MTRLFVTLKPYGTEEKFMYNFCNVEIEVSLDRSFEVSDSYSFLLYNEQFMLLDDSDTGSQDVERSEHYFRVTMREEHVWIPGNYFLLVRSGSGVILRFDLLLDEHGTFTVEGQRQCERMSVEDMLSGRLCRNRTMWRKFSRQPGIMQLKKWAIERAQENELNTFRKSLMLDGIDYCNNMLISTNSSSMMRHNVILLRQVAELEESQVSGDCYDFYDITNNNPYEKLNNFFGSSSSDDNILNMDLPSTKRRMYYFYNIVALTDNGGKTAMRRILSHWPGCYCSAIFCGTQSEINALLEQNPSLQDYFPSRNRLTEEHYSKEELIHLFFYEVKIAKLYLTAEAVDRVCRLIDEAYRKGNISNWTFADMRKYVKDELLPAFCRNAVEGILQGGSEGTFLEVRPCDIVEVPLLSQSSSYDSMLGELNGMVGLDDIKQTISTLFNRMRFYIERRKLGLHTSDGTTYHAIFTGNPGTGKTTVARLLGKIYHSLGLLSRGEVICVDRTKIIGRYIGETEENMKQILKEARGNVLFVDEAYTLYSKGDDKDFGRHAVECLLDVLSRKDPDMLIIFAGYEKEMDKLMSMNPGLVGRFPYKFRFTDYNAEQLMQIAETILAKDQYELTDEAKNLLFDSVCEMVAKHTENFANARWVEQYVRNGIIPALADRVSAIPHVIDKLVYQRIEAADIQVAYQKFNSKTIDLRRRNNIGFCA